MEHASYGRCHWYEQSYFSGGEIPFLGEAILLPPGAHRLTVSMPDVSFDPSTSFQFTVTTRPHNANEHVTDRNASDFVLPGPGVRGALVFEAARSP